VIVAAVISLAQIESARSGKPSLVAVTVATLAGGAQAAVSAISGGIGSGVAWIAAIPKYERAMTVLSRDNARLLQENARLNEAVSRLPDAAAIAEIAQARPGGIAARTVAYDPESETRIATIDRGARAGIVNGEGVIDADGAVGRIIETGPLFSKMLLLTDPASKLPARVQRGRWWGIAVGNGSQIELRYIAQDAKLQPGDLVVTAAGRSFDEGVSLGRVVSLSRPQDGLYQTAVLAPSAEFGRLGAVLVVPR
jgi:rod shape-determining protein MreC